MASKNLSVIVRSLSTSAVQNQMVRPPIQIFGLEGRYATALYSAASKMKQLEAVESELVKFQGSLKTDKKLNEFIANPTIKKEVKIEGVKQISTSLKFSPPTANLVALLAENGRLRNLHSIINAFKTIMSAHRGEIACEVTTAKPLDDATKQELTAALKAFAKKGENILLTTKVDPSIIGGMVVSVGDKYVDMSIASKIKKYTELIQAAV
ncbi:ATP synthase subunit O, mitochondrial-like [Macrosteles quadrilineatus]|uniref:ATP synthase subunit O, mitochondrial-like n=1 Tax=Macrosteles quadrilineatus TaxID=74068 RepID=UPI0023E2C755|nr:ATP synthase subunit O, mitochondrial-like [Macrosteles quadrilineatus]XP_054290606.1 ATP synthase subunit O, mitochondrial-like [Macrosteles quadrilineatus]